MENSSRKHISESEHQSSLKRDPKPQDRIVEKPNIQSPDIKIPKRAIDEYENKIKAL